MPSPRRNDASLRPARKRAIIDCAQSLIGQIGYDRMTITDVAERFGFSKSYVYKFFDSKRDVGDAVVARILSGISDAATERAERAAVGPDRLRTFVVECCFLYERAALGNRYVAELLAQSFREGWRASADHDAWLAHSARTLVVDGRVAGQFDRQSSPERVAAATRLLLVGFRPPARLRPDRQNLVQDVELAADLVVSCAVGKALDPRDCSPTL